MTGVTLYMSGRAKKLKTLPEIIEAETKNAIRRGQNAVRKAIGEEFRKRGIGRAIFEKKLNEKSLKTIIRRDRVKKTGGLYSADVVVKGVAALVARGERSRPHRIGRPGKVLFNPGTGFAATGIVQHLGSQFKRDDFPGRAIASSGAAFRREVDKGMAKVAEMVNRA